MAGSALSRRVSEFTGRRAVRRRADLAGRARHLQPVRPGVVLQHRVRPARRRTSPDGSARSSPSCRISCSATPPISSRSSSPSSAGTTSGAAWWMPPTRRWSGRRCFSRACRRFSRSPSAPSTLQARRSAPAATSATRLAALLAAYLNRTGSIILILTLLFLSIILSTQFSFGRLFSFVGGLVRDRWAAMLGALRARKEERRRDKQRQEVIKKHLDKAKDKETRDGDTKPSREVGRAGCGPRGARSQTFASGDRRDGDAAPPGPQTRRASRRRRRPRRTCRSHPAPRPWWAPRPRH